MVQICDALVVYDRNEAATLVADFVWFTRCMAFPDIWFEYIDANTDLDTNAHNYYLKFEELFGASSCTANVHSLAEHLLTHRRKAGTFGEITAEPYENHYGMHVGVICVSCDL